MSVPQLRFKDEAGRDFPEWQHSILGGVATITSGGTPSRTKSDYWSGDIPWVTTSLIDFNIIDEANEYITESGLKNSSAKLFPKNTLLMAMYGHGKTRGKVAVLGIKATTNQACAAIMLNEKVNTDFVFQNLAGRYDEIRELSNTGGQKNLSAGLIKKITLSYPSIAEQTKIANYLTAVDEKLAQLTRKCDLLTQYKKGVMQQIFSQELRFKDDDGREFSEWELKQLSELLYETKSRNVDSKFGRSEVLSVSGEYGIVNQIQLKGRSFAGKSIANYHIVRVGDVVYTKSPLKNNPFGIIKVNKNQTGVVSTLYAVYGCKEGVLGEYLDYYFQIDANVNNYFRALVNIGAKNDMKINNSHVLSNYINFPVSVSEQRKIVAFFISIDDKITATKTQLAAVKQYKQGLLQQMFV